MRIGREFKTAEYIFGSTENRIFEGRFPVGQNGFWHSGIHIRSPTIHPLLEGQLVAYSIPETYTNVRRPRNISQTEWETLHGYERALYEVSGSKTVFRNMRQVVKNTYRLVNPPQHERYTNGFFLIRHRLRTTVMGEGSQPKQLEFFTLYTNVAPAAGEEDFQPLQRARGQFPEIPFYKKIGLKVAALERSAHHQHRYIEGNGQRIFHGNSCEFWFNSDDPLAKLDCIFVEGTRVIEITLPEASITNRINPRYQTPRNSSVRIYRENMTEQEADKNLDSFAVTTLKPGVSFRKSIAIQFQDFARVRVDQGEVEEEEKIEGEFAFFIVRISDLERDTNTPGTGTFNIDGLGVNPDHEQGTVAGIAVSNAANGSANTLDVLESGTEFELEDPQGFWQNRNQAEQFFALKREDGNGQNRYARINPSNDEGLQVSIVRDERYTIGQTVVTNDKGQMLDQYALLGEPIIQLDTDGGNPVPNSQHFDLVLLFEKNDFLQEGSPFGLYEYFDILDKIADGSAISLRRRIFEAAVEAIKLKGNIVLPIPREVIERGIERVWNLITAGNERREEKMLKRRLVSRHPLEWNKSLYLDEKGAVRPQTLKDFGITNKEREEIFIKHIEAIDIWSGLQDQTISGLDLSENNFWFAHPAYFADTLFRTGILDRSFNPYEGKTITVLADEINLKKRDQKDIQYSPGFTVILRDNDDRGYVFNGVRYAHSTGLFNMPRRNSEGRNIIHTGVDFGAGEPNRRVVSLIHGRVWACTWQGSVNARAGLTGGLGKIMLIKGIGDDKLYLLAHLADYLRDVNAIIEPHDHVAITGTTGFSTAEHLHVEVFTGVPDDRDAVLMPASDKDANNNPIFQGGFPHRNKRVNPFDHTEREREWEGSRL